MSDELFPAESVQMESPRLAWIRKHGVVTHFAEHCPQVPWTAALRFNPGDEPANASAALVIIARVEQDGDDAIGYGSTEDEALIDLAVKYGLKLWNEEGGAM